MYLPYLRKAIEMVNEFIALLKYFGIVFTDGDYANDWLTHLPDKIADAAYILGKWIAPLFLVCMLLILPGCWSAPVRASEDTTPAVYVDYIEGAETRVYYEKVNGIDCLISVQGYRGTGITCDWSQHD